MKTEISNLRSGHLYNGAACDKIEVSLRQGVIIALRFSLLSVGVVNRCLLFVLVLHTVNDPFTAVR
jgi:hypothetical protein